MRYVTMVWVLCWLATPVVGGDYNAVDKNGVRIFSRVPPVGVHPRVILSPEDLPGWRESVRETYRGKEFLAKRYEDGYITALAALDDKLSGKELAAAAPQTNCGNNHKMLFATIDVIYHQDEARAETVCKAVANFARVLLARSEHKIDWGKWEENIGGIQGLNGIRTGLNELWQRGGADFALAYDFLYDYMTEEQRDTCRRALSAATKDLVCWGMDFPRGRGISNWYGYHGELGPMLLAIEGEEGYRPERWEKFSEMIRNWAEVHLYENGGSNEDGYSINTSLREGQFTLIAMARRSENHYLRPNIPNYFKWIVLSLVPGEDTGETVGYSSCRANPYESAPVLARWAMPGNPLVNYYLRQYKGQAYERQKRWQYASWSTLLCMNYEDTEKLPLDIGKLGLPITHVFPYQGLFITRSDWSGRAAYLNVLGRQDAWYDRHENVDRGRFVFAANGRRWVVDRYWGRAQESEHHSLVHIDGKGQVEARGEGLRGKAPHAVLLDHGDVDVSGRKLPPEAHDPGVYSYALYDLSNAYNWMWAHSWDDPGDGWEPETRSFQDLGWPWKRPGQPAELHGCDNREVPMYNFMGCNLWRKPCNTVEKARRLAALVRGHHPYAIICDDIKKDTEAHRYDWYMPIADDLELKSQTGGDVILGEKGEKTEGGKPVPGARRLLVRFLSPADVYISVETYEISRDRNKQPFMGTRLTGAIKCVEPDYKVMLVPFLVGEPLPESRLDRNGLNVYWEDQNETIAFDEKDGKLAGITVKQTLMCEASSIMRNSCMKTPVLRSLFVPLVVILCEALGSAAAALSAAESLAGPAQTPTDILSAKLEVVEAWQDLRYGMFLCWGPVSMTGKEIGWSRGAPAWGQRPGVRGGKGPTAAAAYDDLYKKWKPNEFDAEHWVQVAKEGGMKYLIFLVKHHDGFCLYDTKLTDYKSTGPESAWQVDVMMHVADACHKHDLKLMIYYSQPDWHHPDYLGEHHERYIEYLHGQIRELLTNYGRIDGLWFDNLRGVGPETANLWDAEKLFRMARQLQPHLIINNRCGLPGDFDTPENRVGFFQNDRAWETNATLNGQWAWEPQEADPFFRSFDECIHMLVSCAAGDGNFALNTGPMSDGRIEPRQIERFREIGRWLEKYGESIYGTRGGPFIASDEKTRGHGGYYSHFELPAGRWWGGSTHREDTVYLHVLRWPDDEIVLPGIGRKLTTHSVLTGGEAVVTQDEAGIHVSMPAGQRDPLDTIVKLQFDRSVVGIEPVRTGPPSLVDGGRATASGVWPNPHLGPELAFDDDPSTRWGGAPDSRDGWLAIELAEPKTFSRIRINEAYDRIQKFEIQVKQNDQWRTIHSGTTVGGSFSATFDPVTARHMRLNILEATNVPTIWEIQLLTE